MHAALKLFRRTFRISKRWRAWLRGWGNYFKLAEDRKEVLRLAYDPAFDPMPRPTGQFTLRMDVPVDRSTMDVETVKQALLDIVSEKTGELLGVIRTTLDLNVLIHSFELGRLGETGRARIELRSNRRTGSAAAGRSGASQTGRPGSAGRK